MWQPSCALEILRSRAELQAQIRCFFAARGVLEVETPLLGQSIGTDPGLDYFSSELAFLPDSQTLFLQTSPEYAMKRLLAAGSGSIFQICKAFRNGEKGRLHNPEFTLLEWYRVGFNLSQLMAEIAELLRVLLQGSQLPVASQSHTYQEVFKNYTGLNALVFSLPDYLDCALANNYPEAKQICGQDHATWLDFLFSHLVQPNLADNKIVMIHDYPACQSSMAMLKRDNSELVERVEVFIQGVEIGNGYFELTDPVEQEQRFAKELQQRTQQAKPVPPVDRRLLGALQSGLPQCAGMAIGLDRLLMLMTGSRDISEVLAFPIQLA